MTAILIILGIIVYTLCGALYYGIMEKYINDEATITATCWTWPIAAPVFLLILMGRWFYNKMFLR